MIAFIRLALCAAFLATAALAQQCVQSFVLTTAGQTSSQQDNRTQGCVFWTVTYNSTGFSALSLAFQSAADAGSPSFVTFAGSVDAGINPNTSTTRAYTQFTGYYPFTRMILTSATGTGTIRGTFYGWRADPSGGAIPTPLPVEGCGPTGMPPACDPVVIGAVDDAGNVRVPLSNTAGALASSVFDGTTFQSRFACTNQAAIAATSSGDTQIIALTAAKIKRICHVSISGDTTVNVKFTTGTGSNCGTGTADLTGLYYQVNALALDFTPLAALVAPTAQAICLNLSGTANWGGVVIYASF